MTETVVMTGGWIPGYGTPNPYYGRGSSNITFTMSSSSVWIWTGVGNQTSTINYTDFTQTISCPNYYPPAQAEDPGYVIL